MLLAVFYSYTLYRLITTKADQINGRINLMLRI